MARTSLESVIYAGVFLAPDQRDLLIEKVGEKHSTSFAHHMTLAFKPHETYLLKLEEMFGAEVDLTVTKNVWNDKIQCVVAKCDELEMKMLSENGRPHITMSAADKVTPIASNELLYQLELDRRSNTENVHVEDMYSTIRGTVGVYTTTMGMVTDPKQMIFKMIVSTQDIL